MTNLQALKTNFQNLSDQELKSNLELWGLNPDDVYDANSRNFWWVVYNIIGKTLYTGATSVREGDYQVTYETKGWYAWLNRLADIWGFPKENEFGVIENMTNKW